MRGKGQPYRTLAQSFAPASLSIAADTRLLTAEVDGVPRLPKGTWVKVDALKCPKRVALIARSIAD